MLTVNQRTILQRIVDYGKDKSYVRGMILLGSIARGDHTCFSDIDLAIFGDKSRVFSNFSQNLLNFLQPVAGEVVYSFRLPPNKFVLYLGDPILKVEFFVYSMDEMTKVKKWFLGTRIKDPSQSILLDKDKKVAAALQGMLDHVTELDLAAVSNETIIWFLYYFEQFSYYHARGDIYRAYFLYNIAVHELAKLAYLGEGRKEFPYAPENLFSRVLPKDEVQVFRNLVGTMDPLEMTLKKRQLFDFFMGQVEKLNKTRILRSNAEKLLSFFEQVSQRDLFWNLRYIGFYETRNGIPIKRGKLFRSSFLSKYEEDQVLPWLEANQIRTIIDLRIPEVVQQNPYGQRVLQSVNYVTIPLSIRDFRLDRLEYKNRNPIEILYIHFLLDCKEEIAQIFEHLAKEDSYNLLIHCTAGKDRTGFVIVLVLLLLEVLPDLIALDYLSSGSDSERRTFQTLLDTIEKLGGIRSYLVSTGLDPGTIQRIRRILLDTD